jgi:hypothetical protein
VGACARRNRSEVEGAPDRRGPPIREKREKIKKNKRGKRGCAAAEAG